MIGLGLRKMLSLVLTALACSSPLFASDEDGECTAAIESITTPSSALYRPFAPTDNLVRLLIEFRQSGDCTITANLSAASGETLVGPRGQTLNVQYQDASGLSIRPDGVTAYALPVERITDGRSRIEVFVASPARQNRRAGVYQGALTVALSSGGRILSTADYTLGLNVVEEAMIRIAGTSSGGLAGLDFGVLETDETQTALLLVQANSPFFYEVASENNGVLRHETMGDRRDATISYDAWLDDQPLSLSSPRSYPGASEAINSEGGQLSRLTVQIGDVSGRIAGRYNDTIRITVRVY